MAAIAKKARQTANVARAMANRAADEVKFKRRGNQRELARLALIRANEAAAVAEYAETKARQAGKKHTIAGQTQYGVQVRHDRLCKTQAAALLAAEVARRRLVHRAMCKRVLTAAVNVAKQKQQQRQHHRALAIAAKKAVRKRQQIEQQVVDAG